MTQEKRSGGGLRQVTLAVLWRRKKSSLLLAAIAALGVFAAIALDSLTARQEAAMAEMRQNSIVSCTLTDAKGIQSTHLRMSTRFLDAFLGRSADPEKNLDGYVKNVQAKTVSLRDGPIPNIELRQILNFASDNALASITGAEISLTEGWTEAVFATSQRVCLVPDTLPTELDENQVPYVTLRFNDISAPMRFQVIGTVTGGPWDAIWCPFYAPADPEDPLLCSLAVDCCSFDIADNARLEETREALYQIFVEPDPRNPSGPYGLLIHDEAYQRSWEELRSSLSMLRLLLPALLALCCAVSFFASYLSLRSRLREFAVMRCLGMRRRQLFAQALGEQAVLAAAGALLGSGAGWLQAGALSAGALVKAGISLAAFLLGSALTARSVSRVNVMKLMKVEE